MRIDHDAALRFLSTAYEADDWIAVFLKSYETGRVAQRVDPVSLVTTVGFQDWLERENRSGVNVYVSVNTIRRRTTSRRRTAIATIRHVFLEADYEGPRVLAAIAGRRDLPTPSYVLHSSLNRVHMFWRVTGFIGTQVEALQQQLARELGTDLAATPCSQTTRLAGFLNHKYSPACQVTIDYHGVDSVYGPDDFPKPTIPTRHVARAESEPPPKTRSEVLARARRYLDAIPSAVSGQHGDLVTFRACCRLVRGFALSDDDAFMLLADWNERCVPPWRHRELLDKIDRARRYGREPIGGLLKTQR